MMHSSQGGEEIPHFSDVERAAKRISPFIHKTPLFQSSLLNEFLGHNIVFKAECLQKIGAFKARGGINTVMWLVENGMSPQHIVANSSGNHAQAVAWAAQQQGIPSTIYMPENVSQVKAQATKAYGARVVLCEDRASVDKQVEEASSQEGTYWIPPYNHSQVIAGQGTAAYEALKELNGHVDAVFAPCGGGGLLSGTSLATRALAPQARVIGVEPLKANDAAESRRSGSIQSLKSTPATIADGARTPALGELTFPFIRDLDAFYEVDEPHILYWTQWLQHLLKLHVEPTSAMVMQGVVEWLATQTSRQTVLVVLSGGNVDAATMQSIWAENLLDKQPSL